jgi:ankyrin repeat protein
LQVHIMSRTITLVTVTLAAGVAIGAQGNDARVADAAMQNDVAAVRRLLQQGVDVNGAQGDGRTALHWVAERGYDQVAEVLLARGASVAATTRIGNHTPLHVAATHGHAVVIRQLLQAGADVNARTTTGAAPLHFAAASGRAEAVTLLLDAAADIDARETQWGQTPLMFAAGLGRADVVRALLERGANPHLAAKVVDLSARNREDGAESRKRNARIAAIQKQRAAEKGTNNTAFRNPTPAALAAARDDSGNEPEPLGYAELVGAHGGLTALLLAVREGHQEAAEALLDGGARLNQVSAGDHTSALLMATINGHFDLAMRLLERGADPTIASDAGGTPLYGVLNMQWAPRARHPQPAKYMQQRTEYLVLCEALLKAGADPNARLKKSLWYTTYNRDLLGVDRAGATPFWLAAYTLDIPAMKLLLRYGADPNIPTIKVPERYEGLETNGPDLSGLPPAPWDGPAAFPIHAASGIGYGVGFAGNTHRHVPDGWLPAVKFLVEELGADVNMRDHNGYTAVHHAAARGDNELIRYLVSKGAVVTGVSRFGQTTVDMANGPVERISPFPDTIALLEGLGAKNNHRCVGC